MTPALFVVLSLAGGLGAVARLLLDSLVRSRTSGRYPWGTTVINLTGSLLLGLVVGLTGSLLLPAAWQLVLGTGFLGGYTTFSTASFETVRLLHDRRPMASIANGLGMAALAVAAAAAGYLMGSVP